MTVAPVAASLIATPDPAPRRQSASGSRGLAVSVVICTYTESRWPLLVRAVRSAYHQCLEPAQILVVIDHCPPLLRRARQELVAAADVSDQARLSIIPNAGQRGLSDARNTGVRAARRPIVAFLDDDAAAEPGWLLRLCQHYQDPAVVGVGGRVVPEFEAGRPRWFPPEFDWVIGCTYRGMPGDLEPIRNLIGANMSFRRDALVDTGGFSVNLGRIGTKPLGCEETDLCIRLTAGDPTNLLLYDPRAVVHHRVPAARLTWRYFRARCYSEGLSKAEVRARAGSARVLSSERVYLLATVPTGIGLGLAGVLRGRLAGTARAAALVAGAGLTAWGYLVGRLRRPVTISRALNLAAIAALPLAALLWALALTHVDLAGMGDLGLITVLPLTYWAALVVLSAGFAHAVTRPAPSRPLLAAYTVVLVLVLHGTPTLLYGTLRYAWAWKHVGLIDYLLRHGATDPHISNDLAAYQAWPGFFAGNALLVRAAGLSSALSYASWGPPFFDLVLLGPLVLIFRRFTRDRRLIWVAIWMFFLGNWVGQDYFSPQAAAYFLYLVVIAVALRWYSSSGVTGGVLVPPTGDLRPLRFQPWRRAGVLTVIVVLVVAIATSHQLTPLMLIIALTALVLFRRCSERCLPLVALVLTVGWILVAARGFLSSNFSSIAASLGHPEANAQANLLNLSHASRGQVIVAQVDRLLSAAMWFLALIGGARRWRARRTDLPLLLLALSPLPLIVANSYGGEMVFRVYLFALPFVAFLAAASLFPNPGSGRSRSFPAVLTCFTVVLIGASLVSYYGEEQVNYFSPQEVEASAWLYAHAPAGSLIVGPSGDLPWDYKNIESYHHYWFALDTPKGRQAVLARPVASLRADLTDRAYPASFLVFTRAQAAEVDTTGLMPAGSIAGIERAVMASGLFRVVYANREATIVTTARQPGRA